MLSFSMECSRFLIFHQLSPPLRSDNNNISRTCLEVGELSERTENPKGNTNKLPTHCGKKQKNSSTLIKLTSHQSHRMKGKLWFLKREEKKNHILQYILTNIYFCIICTSELESPMMMKFFCCFSLSLSLRKTSD